MQLHILDIPPTQAATMQNAIRIVLRGLGGVADEDESGPFIIAPPAAQLAGLYPLSLVAGFLRGDDDFERHTSRPEKIRAIAEAAGRMPPNPTPAQIDDALAAIHQEILS